MKHSHLPPLKNHVSFNYQYKTPKILMVNPTLWSIQYWRSSKQHCLTDFLSSSSSSQQTAFLKLSLRWNVGSVGVAVTSASTASSPEILSTTTFESTTLSPDSETGNSTSKNAYQNQCDRKKNHQMSIKVEQKLFH